MNPAFLNGVYLIQTKMMEASGSVSMDKTKLDQCPFLIRGQHGSCSGKNATFFRKDRVTQKPIEFPQTIRRGRRDLWIAPVNSCKLTFASSIVM